MIILHGENTSRSWAKQSELLEKAKSAGTEILKLAALKLTPALLEEALGGGDLFGTKKLIIIDELHSLPTSTRKKELIEKIAQTQTSGGSDSDNLILTEKKTLTATMLKKFPGAQVFEFKVDNLMWEFLDNIGTWRGPEVVKRLHAVIAAGDEFFVFTMLCRQVRLLISAKEGTLKLPGFMAEKLKRQASKFSLPQLLELHRQLFKLEIEQKTSKLTLSLGQELDLLLFKL